MRSIEESLQILDKMPAFQKKFEIFKQGIISAAQAGLTYRGNPVQMSEIYRHYEENKTKQSKD